MRRKQKTVHGKFSEVRHGNAQDKVLEGYKKRFGLQEGQASNLHMFFSPTRVAKGLTKEEVQILLFLYSSRDALRRQKIGRTKKVRGVGLTSFSGLLRESMLPNEFCPAGRITRRDFRIGVRKLVEDQIGTVNLLKYLVNNT